MTHNIILKCSVLTGGKNPVIILCVLRKVGSPWQLMTPIALHREHNMHLLSFIRSFIILFSLGMRSTRKSEYVMKDTFEYKRKVKKKRDE